MDSEIEHIEGENLDCDWLKFIKFPQNITIPDAERKEIIDNYDTQKNYSRLKKISKENLIFFFIGTKIFFINKTNLPQFFKKVKIFNKKLGHKNYIRRLFST